MAQLRPDGASRAGHEDPLASEVGGDGVDIGVDRPAPQQVRDLQRAEDPRAPLGEGARLGRGEGGRQAHELLGAGHDTDLEAELARPRDDAVDLVRAGRGHSQQDEVGVGLPGHLRQGAPGAEHPHPGEPQVPLGGVVVEQGDGRVGRGGVVLHEADRRRAAVPGSHDDRAAGALADRPLAHLDHPQVEPSAGQVEGEGGAPGEDGVAQGKEESRGDPGGRGQRDGDDDVGQQHRGDLVDRREASPPPQEDKVAGDLEDDGQQCRQRDPQALGARVDPRGQAEGGHDHHGQRPHRGVERGGGAVGQVQAGAADLTLPPLRPRPALRGRGGLRRRWGRRGRLGRPRPGRCRRGAMLNHRESPSVRGEGCGARGTRARDTTGQRLYQH